MIKDKFSSKGANDSSKSKSGNKVTSKKKVNNSGEINNLANRISKAFQNEQSSIISAEDYGKIMNFLYHFECFDAIKSIVCNVNFKESSKNHNVRIKLMLEKTDELLKDSRLDTINQMYALTEADLEPGSELTTILSNHFKRVSSDINSLKNNIDTIYDVFPNSIQFKEKISDAAVIVANVYADVDFRSCHVFEGLNKLYISYKTAVPKILKSEDFKKIFERSFSVILNNIKSLEELYLIRNVMSSPNRDKFLNDSSKALIQKQCEFENLYMDASQDIPTLNKQFNRAYPDIKKLTSGKYCESLWKILKSGLPLGLLSENYKEIQWEFVSDAWKLRLENALGMNIVNRLNLIRSREIKELNDITKTDFGVIDVVATKIHELSKDGLLDVDSNYAWLNYFKSIPNPDDSVEHVVSILNLQIGKSLMDDDPKAAISYLQNAKYESLDGLEVYSMLVMARQSFDQGKFDLALSYADGAIESQPSMTCAGLSFKALVSNYKNPDFEAIKKAEHAFLDEYKGLDEILMEQTQNNLATAIREGNLPVESKLNQIMDLNIKITPYFRSVFNVKQAMDWILAEDYENAESILIKVQNILKDSNLVDIVALLRMFIQRYSNMSDYVDTDLEPLIEKLNATSSFMFDKWVVKMVDAIKSERSNMWRYSVDKYDEASIFAYDHDDIKVRQANQYMQMAEYDQVQLVLESVPGNNVMASLLKIEANMKTPGSKRDVKAVSRVETTDSYGCAYKLYLEGLRHDNFGAYGNAYQNYVDAIDKLANSQKRRDVLFKANMYYRCALALFNQNKVDKMSDVNQNLLEALDLIDVNYDRSENFRSFREKIVLEKERMNSTKVSASIDSEEVSNVITLRYAGMEVAVTGKPIGVGGTYKVYKGIGHNEPYAVRVLQNLDIYSSKTFSIRKADIDKMDHELEIWSELTDVAGEYVVNLKDTSDDPFPSQLIEYADESFGKAFTRLNKHDRGLIIVRMLRCLQAIHDAGFVHNDVKPDNLMFVKGVWKITDFDITVEEGESYEGEIGTFDFKSPEQFCNEPITGKSDVWAVGVILYRSLTNMMFPFNGQGQEYRENVINCRYVQGKISARYEELLSRVFSRNPEVRPTAGEFADELELLIND